MRRQHYIMIGLGAMAVAIAVGGAWWYRARQSHSPTKLANSIPEGVTESDFDAAARQFEERYGRPPERVDILSWLGESAIKEGRWDAALAALKDIPPETPRYGHLAQLYQGKALLKLNQAPQAEEKLRTFLRLEQEHEELPDIYVVEGLLQLDYLLSIELRFEERKTVLKDLIRFGAAQRDEILNYCFPSLMRWNGSLAANALEAFYEENSQDPRLRAALGRYRTGQGRVIESRKILEELRAEYPKSLTTAAALLACFYEEERWDEMDEIIAQLPPPEDSHPWLLLRLRGHSHNRRQEYSNALTCFERLLKSNPTDVEGWLGKAAALAGLNQTSDQEDSLQIARDLSLIQNRAGWALNDRADPQPLLEIAEIAERAGLIEEARLVVGLGLKETPQHEPLLAMRTRLQLQQDRPR